MFFNVIKNTDEKHYRFSETLTCETHAHYIPIPFFLLRRELIV